MKDCERVVRCEWKLSKSLTAKPRSRRKPQEAKLTKISFQEDFYHHHQENPSTLLVKFSPSQDDLPGGQEPGSPGVLHLYHHQGVRGRGYQNWVYPLNNGSNSTGEMFFMIQKYYEFRYMYIRNNC